MHQPNPVDQLLVRAFADGTRFGVVNGRLCIYAGRGFDPEVVEEARAAGPQIVKRLLEFFGPDAPPYAVKATLSEVEKLEIALQDLLKEELRIQRAVRAARARLRAHRGPVPPNNSAPSPEAP